MAKNCGVTAAKKWDLRGAKLEDSTERCSLPRSCFLDVTPSSPQRDIQKTAARETMKDGDGRKAATLWGQSDFGSFCAGPQIKDNGKVARFGLRALHR